MTAARNKLKDADVSDAQHFQLRMARAESKLKMHEIMQRWIEQWRTKMAAEKSTPGDDTARHNIQIDNI